MKRFIIAGVAALALGVLGGCVTAARIETRQAELVEKWQAEHPGQPVTDAVLKELYGKAEAEVKVEAAKEREEAAAKLGSTASAFASGNILGGIFGLIGLGGLGFSAIKKAKGDA